MAETDISHEFGREPGFSSLVFAVFDPEGSHMLHIQLEVVVTGDQNTMTFNEEQTSIKTDVPESESDTD